MTKRAPYHGISGCSIGTGLTSDVEKVKPEDRVCPCNTCADGAVSPM